MILSCQNITKSFAEKDVLREVSFHLEDHEKAALIGANGAGKSTLFKIIIGELQPDEGDVSVSHGKTIGYLAQYQDVSGDETIYEAVRKAKAHVFALEEQLREAEQQMQSASGEVLESLMKTYHTLQETFEQENGYACESEITGVLKGLGFSETEFGRKLSTLSGGQKTRIVLGRLLLTSPDILLLDEPTNHLDMDSIRWLETYLSNYRGSVLVISHDRYFLDRIVTKVIEIENGKALSFQGNYTDFGRKKAQIRQSMYNAYIKQQAEIKHQEAVIAKLKSFNREKSIKRAESREKLLEKTERLEKPDEPNADMHLTLHPRYESGKDVMEITHLTKAYPHLPLFSDQNIFIRRGERVAVIGGNGTGKTTLLRIINGLEQQDEGDVRFGAKVKIGYYDQEQQVLHPEKTIFEEIQDTYPTLDNTTIRNVLAAFLFTGDDVFKKISALSGGERGRVSLARLMLSEANFLILDEPTNHLDITSKEILEDALNEYTGTVLYVSHDRYFINQTATRILELTHQQFIGCEGNYDYYLEKRDELLAAAGISGFTEERRQPDGQSDSVNLSAHSETTAQESSSRNDWLAQKEEQARKRKKDNALKKLEEEIAGLEARDAEIDAEFLLPETGTDLPKCQKLSKEQAALKEKLESLYEKWEELAE